MTYESLTVTNTYVSPKIDVEVNKVWVGGPETKPTIQLQLFRNDEVFGEPVTLENGTLKHTFVGLDKTDSRGVDYVYTVDELVVPKDYTKVAKDLTVTNTYVQPKEPAKDKPKDLPKTGSAQGLYEVLGLVTLVGGAVMLTRKKKD